jgi:hypothetical protein
MMVAPQAEPEGAAAAAATTRAAAAGGREGGAAQVEGWHVEERRLEDGEGEAVLWFSVRVVE